MNTKFSVTAVTLASLLWAPLLFLSGCNGCGSKAAEEQARLNTQTQQLIEAQTRLADQQKQAQEEEHARQQATEAQRQQYKAAITNVAQQMATIFEDHNQQMSSIMKRIGDVDISQCPPDFSQAYVDLQSSLENLRQVMTTRADFDSDANAGTVLGETIFSVLSNNNAQPLQDALSRDDQLKQQEQEARNNVIRKIENLQRISAGYGVT